MTVRVVKLSSASHDDNIRALDEVRDFATTDMGYGGTERWTYRVLSEPALTEELMAACNPRSRGRVDSVTFQPCKLHHYRSQDRCVVEEWALPGGTWTFTGVFDGHVNHDTVDYVSQRLPMMLKKNLETRLRANTQVVAPEEVSSLLSNVVMLVDNTITTDFLDIFPREQRYLRNMNPAYAKQLVDDQASGGHRYRRVARALGGTTVLVTLTDPTGENLWIANLGDCCAVLGSRDLSNDTWSGTLINSVHNGNITSAELRRIRTEHPGEAQCVLNNRVAGFLEPTRAVGDAWLKVPAVYTRNVCPTIDAPWFTEHTFETYLHRVLTPPYVSNKPDVYHRRLRRRSSAGPRSGILDSFLITCSDGLPDLCNGQSLQAMVDHWTQVVGREMEMRMASGRRTGNSAAVLLRDSLGGEDTRRTSRNLTVEMEERWLDDTTILVQNFV